MDVKEEEINVLGDGGPEINAISIDIKIQKVDETGSGIAEFFDNINVYVGDTIRFNVIVTNLIQYNLSDIKIINKLPYSYFLTFIEGYNEENKISAVSLKDELLTWEIEELHI